MAGKQAFDHHWKQLGELTKHWLELSFPWTTKSTADDNRALMERWKRAHKIKDMRSAEAQSRIQAACDSLKSRRGPEQNTAKSGIGNWCDTGTK